MNSAYELTVFQFPRLASLEGYQDIPLVYAVMLFFLPAFSLLSLRFVFVNEQSYEIWSPNSRQKPYYAGLPDPNFRAGRHLKTELRRCDGHTGRFDPTISPQHFVAAYPWFGYIRRDMGNGLPEFEIAAKGWRRAGRSGGYFSGTFLHDLRARYLNVVKAATSTSAMSFISPESWAGRPTESPDELETLNTYLTFDEATDCLANAQKTIKYFDAWNRFAAATIREYEASIVQPSRVEEADDSLVGTWLNGASETEGLALLRHRVPCFIVSLVSSPRDLKRAQSAARNYDFVSSSDVVRLSKDSHRADQLVAAAGGEFNALKRDLGLATAIPAMSTEDLARASSTAQGFIDPYYSNPRPSTSIATTTDPLALNSAVNSIMPPAVSNPTAGKWSCWREDTLDDNSEPCLLKIGAKARNSCRGHRYYDREGRRYLEFDEKVDPPENYSADVNVFGLPVPKILFMERVNNKDLERRRPSNWMYKTERPKPGELGRVYSPVEISKTRDSKANEQPTRSRSVSEVSMGSETESVVQDVERGRTTERPRSVTPEPVRITPNSPHRSWRPRGDFYRPRYRERSPSREGHYYSRSISRGRREEKRRYEPEGSSAAYRKPILGTRSSLSERERNRFAWLAPREDSMDVDKADKGKAPVRSVQRRSPSSDKDSEDSSRSSSRSGSPLDRYMEDRVVPTAPAEITTQLQNGGQNVSLAVASSSTAVIPYSIPIPSEEQLQTLNEIFPTLAEAPMQVRDVIVKGTRTRFLTIWNFPVYFLWRHVVEWIIEVLDDLPKVSLRRVLRTNQDGYQVFWFKFDKEESATNFRGSVDRRRLWPGGQYCYCDFVIDSDYAGANGRSSDFWELAGLSHGRELATATFDNPYCSKSISAPSLRQRLGLPNPDTEEPAPSKPSKTSRRNTKLANRLGITVEQLKLQKRKTPLADRLGPPVPQSNESPNDANPDRSPKNKRRRTHK